MNIAQALGIAVAICAYAIFMEEPWSARYAMAHAEAREIAAEVEAVGEAAIAETQALVIAALQQSVPLALAL